MSRLTLVFTICSVIIAGAHFALVNGEAAPDQLENPINDQEEASERSGQEDARAPAYAQRNVAIRLRPVNRPLNSAMLRPPPYIPVNSTTCYSCQGCEKVDKGTTLVVNCAFYNELTGCVTYSKTSPDKNPLVVRGCISELGNCEYIRNNMGGLGRVLSCSECKGNNCNDKNGAGSAVPNHFIAAMAMLAAPILTKVFFSKM